jgi:hypothetical protein
MAGNRGWLGVAEARQKGLIGARVEGGSGLIADARSRCGLRAYHRD